MGKGSRLSPLPIQGHFHVFVGRFDDGRLSDVRQLTPEHVSDLPRYYYSKGDHEISQVWSRDGSGICSFSNRGTFKGRCFWRIKVSRARSREIHYERQRGRRVRTFLRTGRGMVYASYLGRLGISFGLMPVAAGSVSDFLWGF